MTDRRREAGAPLGGAADRFFAIYSPREAVNENIPSGAPRDAVAFASNWFLLIVLGAGLLLLFIALWVVLAP